MGSGTLPDPVHATWVPGDEVLGSLDVDLGAEHGTEQLELSSAEAGARRGGSADRAVVLDEQNRVTVEVSPCSKKRLLRNE
jgi:hypothetical protein